MASLKTISLPHGTIPTQMFGNVNLQNAVMYVNENFAEVKSGVNEAISATNDALKEKAELDHDHDDAYAALEHTHGIDAVTGLNAALDDKAALNHEHSQYLSSLPAHYHDVAGIQGLGEQLQTKAEKVHSHTTAQVDGLDTKLGVLASTSYVDQQVNNVGSSIKTIADQEVVDYGASKQGSGGAASVDVPVNAELAPTDETVSQKNARVGTADRWARADHKHVFATETSDIAKLKHDGNGTGGAASFGVETNVPRIDHSHPLNFPTAKPISSISPDGIGEGGTALFGDTNYYADLGHSHPLNVATSGTPSDTVKPNGTASNGTSEYYARQDHVHKMAQLNADDVTYSGNTSVGDQIDTNVEELNDHEDRIAALESAPAPSAPVTSVNGKTGAVVLGASDVGAIADGQIGVSVQAYSAPLTTLSANLNTDGTIPSSNVKDANCTSGGDCLAYFNESKQLAHLGNAGITVSKANSIDGCFVHAGSGAQMTSVLNYKAAGANAAPTAKKAVGFAANADTASLIDVATVDDQATAVTDGTLMTYKDGRFVEDGNTYLNDSSIGDGLEYDDQTEKVSVSADENGGIKIDGTTKKLKINSSASGSSTVSLGYFPDDTEQPSRQTPLWEAGGSIDATLLVVFTGIDDGGGGCELRTCKITITPFGTIKKIEQIKNGGISII